MPVAAGVRLGAYEVLGPIGSGGMGEVYRARDTRLGREVAIKVLPAERLSDPARRARFVQEARAASSLNHPNIVTIHEIESAEGVDFIVMELVPGKTLDALIPRHGMRLGEVLRIAIPLADALAAAHAAGIVHRDLKPANVMVTPDGVVKVLDFGLAKLRQDDVAGSEDDTTLEAQAKLSRAGTVAGTPAYMSPEQASGGVVDTRSDVFSFGAVLYEMVTGRRPFAGGSSAELMASLLKEEPGPPSALVPDLPKELERIILRCLRKDPARRFQHMTDLKVELLEVKEESDSHGVAAGAAIARGWSLRRRWIALGAVGLLVLATAAAVAVRRLSRPERLPPTVVRLSSERYVGGGSFSPDGTQIAFASAGEDGANWDIWVKIVGEAEARRLTNDPATESAPSWSPDGTQIAFLRYEGLTGMGAPFFDAGAVCLVSPVTGSSRRLSDFPARVQLSWSPDSRWLATSKARSGSEPPGGVYLISAATGEPRAVTFPKPPAFDVAPAFSPDGRALAYAACGGVEGNPACDVNVLPLDSELRPQGAARPLTRQRLWMGGLAWTRDGRSIVYGAGGGLWRARVDGSAPAERVEQAGGEAVAPSTALHRDRLAFSRSVWDPDIYRLQLGGPPSLLIGSAFADWNAQYSPDGQRIAFESWRTGGTVEEIWLAEADGSNPTRLTRGPGAHQGSPRWSPDGRSVAFDSRAENGHVDIWTIGVDGSGLRQVTHDPVAGILPSWSRDGRFIYFSSNRTGHSEVWRVPALGGAEEQVTREGGAAPFESLDGRTLYYLKSEPKGALATRPTTGGEERTVVGCVAGAFTWAVTPQGLFYVACGSPSPSAFRQQTLRYWDAVTGQDRPVATFESDGIWGLSASPDGQSILYGRGSWSNDLMMIENFR